MDGCCIFTRQILQQNCNSVQIELENIHKPFFYYYGKLSNGKKYPFANVKKNCNLFWKSFSHLNILFCQLRVSKWQKISRSNGKKVTFANGHFLPLNVYHNRKNKLLDVLLPSPATIACCKSDDENTAPRDLKYDIVWPSKSDMEQAK